MATDSRYYKGALIADIARLAGLNDDLSATSGIRGTRSIALLYQSG